MSWQVYAVGVPAALVTAMNAVTSGSQTTQEIAQVARAQTAVNAELNSYAATQQLVLQASGAANQDGDRISINIQPVLPLAAGTINFTMPP